MKWYDKSLRDIAYDLSDVAVNVIVWFMKTFIPKKVLRNMVINHFAKQKPEVTHIHKEDLRT